MGSPPISSEPDSMFLRSRKREVLTVPIPEHDVALTTKSSNSSCSKQRESNKMEPFANLRTFFRMHNHSNNKRKDKKAQLLIKAVERGSMRQSSSTNLTRSTTCRSSAFLMEPITMSGFLLPGELAAFEEGKEEIADFDEHDELGITSKTELGCTWKLEEEEEESESKPLHKRHPAPESYFEMTKNKHQELGNIQFEFESLEEAKEEAMLRQWPILSIEAEVPGDVTAGETIFSHPLIVEAAESLFVTVQPRQLEPQDDEDETQSRRFFCNSACRTRVRILDDRGIDVVAPVERMSMAEVVSAFVRGLESYRTPVPQYLQLLLEEETGKVQVLSKTRVRETQGQAIFGMFDSVTAEIEFAGLDGVLSTRSGALVRQQVVQVTYDSWRLSYGALVRHALRRTGANVIYFESNDERIAGQLEVQHFQNYRKVQQRYADHPTDADSIPDIKVVEYFGNVRSNHHCRAKPALRGSILRFVPMTNLQATRANRLCYLQKFDEAMHLMSPRQGLIAMQALRAHHSKDFHDVVDVPICSAWNELSFNSDERDLDSLADKLHYVMGDEEDEDYTECLAEEVEDPFLQ